MVYESVLDTLSGNTLGYNACSRVNITKKACLTNNSTHTFYINALSLLCDMNATYFHTLHVLLSDTDLKRKNHVKKLENMKIQFKMFQYLSTNHFLKLLVGLNHFFLN